MLLTYRDILIENRMDFTDVIKFFNGTRVIVSECAMKLDVILEMAERHQTDVLLDCARSQLRRLQDLLIKETK